MGLSELNEAAWISEDKRRWLLIDQFPTRGMALHELALAAELGLKDQAEVRLNRAFTENEQAFREDLERFSQLGGA
jgi:hypothetical protein